MEIEVFRLRKRGVSDMKLILLSGGLGKKPLMDLISKGNHIVLSADFKRKMLHLEGVERKC